ncbi:MAG TPA: proline--tRNA ligase [Firmicutes bacterium]|nr:proline--tRNA ligase [Bacillota bacterium]
MENNRKNDSITRQEDNFAQWYTDICLKAELMSYARTKGFIVYRPYGYAMWEMIQDWFNREIKKTGHSNVYLPCLIPESLLNMEKEHVEGFAPECAIVTIGGNKPLTERLYVRPTSETLFCDYFKDIVHSFRDLPVKCNQWCSVVRWEKTTRPFLRGAEFLWQEGHTLHATKEEAEAETLGQLHLYERLGKELLAIPFTSGRKTESEKFAGAIATYTIEALMKDGQALQSGTSHFFGQGFAQHFGIQFLDRDNVTKTPWQTSWGVSTRLLGAVIMTHGDDNGLVLPPYIAPVQVAIIPIRADKDAAVAAAGQKLYDELTKAGVRVVYDTSKKTPGWKFSQYEMKGVPVRIEVGPRDLAQGIVTLTRRYDGSKFTLPVDQVAAKMGEILKDIHEGMYQKALAYKESHTVTCHTYAELKDVVTTGKGFARVMWCGDHACEEQVKKDCAATSRCLPFDQTPFGDTCCICGKPAKYVVLFDRAY